MTHKVPDKPSSKTRFLVLTSMVCFALWMCGCATSSKPNVEATPAKKNAEWRAPQSRPGTENEGPELREARLALVAYLEAIQKGEGKKAQRLVQKNTMAHFRSVHHRTLYAEQEELLTLNSSDRLIVLRLRSELNHKALKALNPETFFETLVNRSLMGSQGLGTLEIGPGTLRGPDAHFQIWSQNQSTGVHFNMKKEGGTWRFDFLKMRDLSDQSIQAALESKGLDPVLFEMQVLQKELGHSVDPKVWNAPLKETSTP